MVRCYIKLATVLLFTIALTSCVGRTSTLYDEIFLLKNGTLEKADGSIINIDKEGEEIRLNVVFPWSKEISIKNDHQWINVSRVSVEEYDGIINKIDKNRLTKYYITTINITVDNNSSKSRSGTITLSCDYYNDICVSNIIIMQNGS